MRARALKATSPVLILLAVSEAGLAQTFDPAQIRPAGDAIDLDAIWIS